MPGETTSLEPTMGVPLPLEQEATEPSYLKPFTQILELENLPEDIRTKVEEAKEVAAGFFKLYPEALTSMKGFKDADYHNRQMIDRGNEDNWNIRPWRKKMLNVRNGINWFDGSDSPTISFSVISDVDSESKLLKDPVVSKLYQEMTGKEISNQEFSSGENAVFSQKINPYNPISNTDINLVFVQKGRAHSSRLIASAADMVGIDFRVSLKDSDDEKDLRYLKPFDQLARVVEGDSEYQKRVLNTREYVQSFVDDSLEAGIDIFESEGSFKKAVDRITGIRDGRPINENPDWIKRINHLISWEEGNIYVKIQETFNKNSSDVRKPDESLNVIELLTGDKLVRNWALRGNSVNTPYIKVGDSTNIEHWIYLTGVKNWEHLKFTEEQRNQRYSVTDPQEGADPSLADTVFVNTRLKIN